MQTLQWLCVISEMYSFIFELSLTLICAQGTGDMLLHCCMLHFVLLALLPPAKHSDTSRRLNFSILILGKCENIPVTILAACIILKIYLADKVFQAGQRLRCRIFGFVPLKPCGVLQQVHYKAHLKLVKS